MKISHHWFYDELLVFNFRLVWSVDKAALERYIKDEFGVCFVCERDNFGGKALEIHHDPHVTFLIALKQWNGNADDHATLGHECVHAANMILAGRGVVTTQENDEATAYLTGYLLRKCLNVLLPKKLRVRVDSAVVPKKRR